MEILKDTAAAYIDAGLSAIPTAADKRPACAWKTFTERRMSAREIAAFFARADGIGIVCGKVSGNLELLDFDDAGSQFAPWLAKVPAYLRERLVVERSPSGGRHVYYRVSGGEVPGNRKLAMKADGHVLIETRGEGGYVKCAPSAGYALEQGSLTAIPSVSAFEQQLLIEAAQELNAHPSTLNSQLSTLNSQPSSLIPHTSSLATPWDDYAQRGDFAALMERHGWKRTGGARGNEHWERPGKDGRSTSATWNGEVFYVFSSNAAPFEPNRGYGKFQAYALLECGGDAKEAARRLRSEGYGGMAPAPQPATPNSQLSTPNSQLSTPNSQLIMV